MARLGRKAPRQYPLYLSIQCQVTQSGAHHVVIEECHDAALMLSGKRPLGIDHLSVVIYASKEGTQ